MAGRRSFVICVQAVVSLTQSKTVCLKATASGKMRGWLCFIQTTDNEIGGKYEHHQLDRFARRYSHVK